MKLLALALIGIFMTSASQRAPLSAPDVEQAIQLAKNSKESVGPSCVARLATSFFDLSGAGPNDGPFDVTIVGPVGRIMQAARAATRKHLPFAVTDVGAEMRAPALLVTAMPQRSINRSGITYRSGPATGLVFRSRPPKGESPIEVKPLAFELRPAPVGLDSMEGRGIVARFDLGAVAALPTPEIEVAVVTQLRDRVCKLNGEDRQKIR